MADDRQNENSYRKILKGTSIFGGVQIFQVLINLIRGKFVAMFLGPEGMGMAAMFTSASNTITRFSSLGLNLAFVKEVAASRDDPSRLSQIRFVVSLLLRFTSLLGALVCVFLSPWLSSISFGSPDYAWQFALLGIAVGLTISADGKLAVLQGLHKVKLLSTASLLGAVTGLVAGVPLYYFFGTRGIVPAIIILSVTSFLFYSFGVRRAIPRTKKISFSKRLHSPLIRNFLSLGIILLAASLINTGCSYAINIFIRFFGNLSDVGLFNAANSVTLQYTGVVFTAMALDYFPRLSAASKDPDKMRGIVNRQMEIVALMAAPLSILLVGTAPIIIRLLLTQQFLPITPLMRWLGISILLKALAYPLGYIAFAKNNRRLFFWLEGVVCNILYLGLSLIFYYRFGLIGLGYAAVVEQAACVLLYMAVNYKVYGYHFNKDAATETLIAILFGTAGFCASITTDGILSYYLLATVLLISATRSFLMLKNRIKQ